MRASSIRHHQAHLGVRRPDSGHPAPRHGHCRCHREQRRDGCCSRCRGPCLGLRDACVEELGIRDQVQGWVVGILRSAQERARGVGRVGQHAAHATNADALRCGRFATVAHERIGIVAAGFVAGEALQADVAELSPGRTPAVPDQPITLAILIAVAHENHSMVDDRVLLGATVENARRVQTPAGGGDTDRHRIDLHGRNEGICVVLRQLVIPRDPSPRCLLARHLETLAVVLPDAAGVRPSPKRRHSFADGVVEGQLRSGTLAAAGASTLLRIRHARGDLLRREVEQSTGLQCDGGLEHGRRSEGPATAAGALVLDCRDDDGAVVAPIEGLREVFSLLRRGDVPSWRLPSWLLHVAKVGRHFLLGEKGELVQAHFPGVFLVGVVGFDVLHSSLEGALARVQLWAPVLQSVLLEVRFECRHCRPVPLHGAELRAHGEHGGAGEELWRHLGRGGPLLRALRAEAYLSQAA
mmetsp:Transcript_41892/g.135591  ORF Transcript_41892/g.135591 Transcript_41892/m.135591 type:complete len:468 (-) Transcript_41892:8-1411(-)